jgi:hypothetical protein
MPATGPACSPGWHYVIHSALAINCHSAHIATYGERAVDVFYLTSRRRQVTETKRGRGPGCAAQLLDRRVAGRITKRARQ